MSTVLVTGGTGLLGRAVAAGLAAAGHNVRVLSRTADSPAIATGDLSTGDGLDAARRAATPHLVFVSIVGVDRIPWASYRTKADAERAVAGSGPRWTTLRAISLAERSPERVGSRSGS